MQSEQGRGGARAGSGRKNVNPDEPSSVVRVVISQSHLDWLVAYGKTVGKVNKAGKVNVAGTVRELIDAAMTADTELEDR